MRKLSQAVLLCALVLTARLHLDDPSRAQARPEAVPPLAGSADSSRMAPSVAAQASALRSYLDRQGIAHADLDLARLADRIYHAARRNGVEPNLVMAMIRTESTFQPYAVSRKGAVGLMQLLPATAEAVAEEMGLEWEGAHQLFEPDVNIELGTYYLRKLLDRFHGDLDLALEAYNRGPTRLARLSAGGGRPPRSYANRVLRRREELR
jgi:soluble lytic murein transglycosylase-like protein